MLQKRPVPDQSITQKVTNQLVSHGIRAPCNVEVRTNRGTVTISGKIEYEHQRAAVLHMLRTIDGVAQVVDQMQVAPKMAQWK
jgi:osmotically-inducible protein OsmY